MPLFKLFLNLIAFLRLTFVTDQINSLWGYMWEHTCPASIFCLVPSACQVHKTLNLLLLVQNLHRSCFLQPQKNLIDNLRKTTLGLLSLHETPTQSEPLVMLERRIFYPTSHDLMWLQTAKVIHPNFTLVS